ncbi:hypothetical protein AGMMS49975_08300 [Clostridia bacterium]|nr:hypothetical protein AGMMS49975_08300 [Clostridia bacterium]
MPNTHDRYQDGENVSSTHIRDMLKETGHQMSPPSEHTQANNAESSTHVRDMLKDIKQSNDGQGHEQEIEND